MDIHGIRLKGFIGIKRGTGLDEVSLDLSDLGGLVALDGPNGHGKTTVLDNLHPYRCLASRNSSLQRHVFLRDSEKEFSFRFGGVDYRTLLKIDSDSDRSEAFIYKNGNSHSETNGKVTEYSKYIDNLFGSQTLFFNSIFCAQNSGKLSDLTTGDLKKLFSEFLRLERLIGYEDTSKQCGNIISAHIESLDKKIEDLKFDISSLGNKAGELEETKKRLQDEIKERDGLLLRLSDTEAALTKYHKALSQNELIEQRIRDFQANIDQINKDIETDSRDTEAKLQDLKTSIREVRRDIEECRALLQNQDEIRAAAERKEKIATELAPLKELVADLQKRFDTAYSEMSTLNSRKAEANNVLTVLNSDTSIRIIESEIRACKEKMQDLDRKDPACQSTICSFIIGALKAKEQLPELEKQFEEKQSVLSVNKEKLQAKLDEINKEITPVKERFESDKNKHDELNNTINNLESELKAVEAKAKYLSDINTAEEKKRILEQREKELLEEGTSAKESFDKRKSGKEKQVEEYQDQITTLQAEFDSTLTGQITLTEQALNLIKSDISETEELISGFRVSVATIEKDLNEKQVKEGELTGAQEDKNRLVSELTDWKYLKNACSKDGLRALEIDSVAPIITGYANDLLNATFGPNYTVKFRTQDEETGKEILDILAIREDGSEVLLDNLSGGEKVWSLKALRLAMTLVSKEKSGRGFKTALSDEEDGALDAGNAQNFISLYRAFMQSGGFNACYYISHRPECVAMADHVLKFGKGGISIVR